MRRSSWFYLLIAAAAVAAGITFGAVRGKTPEKPAAKAVALEFLPSDLHTVKSAPLERTLPITGTLAPLVEATLRAKAAGELALLAVREGESVRRGGVVARVDQTELQARVAARAADVEAARAQLVLAEKNRATQQALLDKNFISRNAFDSTQSSYDVARARLAAAEADLAVARKALGDAVLVAPFDGVVAERHAQPGERVALDGKVVTLVDLSRLELDATVPASLIGQVRPGQPITFQVDGFGERRFAGRVERINPTTTAGSRSISIYASVDNADRLLRGGMFARGALVLERFDAALAIPASAVREEAGRAYVYVIDAGAVRRRPVELGAEDAAGNVNVLKGLAAGDVIVRSNLGALREGAGVRLLAGNGAEKL